MMKVYSLLLLTCIYGCGTTESDEGGPGSFDYCQCFPHKQADMPKGCEQFDQELQRAMNYSDGNARAAILILDNCPDASNVGMDLCGCVEAVMAKDNTKSDQCRSVVYDCYDNAHHKYMWMLLSYKACTAGYELEAHTFLDSVGGLRGVQMFQELNDQLKEVDDLFLAPVTGRL